MATIHDIAKYAKVAPSTVSHVLNNTKHVTPATKARVLRAIEHFDYTPSQLARSLKTKKTYTIGMIVPDISNSFFTEIIGGVEEITTKHDYSTILCSSNEDPVKEEKHIQTLLQRGVDGLILVGTGNSEVTNLVDVPVVTVDRSIDSKLNSIQVDNEKGAFIATDYLLSKGLAPVLMLTSNITSDTYTSRLSGYNCALEKHNIQYDERYIMKSPASYSGGFDSMTAALHSNLKFHSVFATNDYIAMGAIRAIKQYGLRIPDDLSIIGFDDIPAASYSMPSLTTIHQPQREMGKLAAEIILNKLEMRKSSTKHILLEPKLIVREST